MHSYNTGPSRGGHMSTFDGDDDDRLAAEYAEHVRSQEEYYGDDDPLGQSHEDDILNALGGYGGGEGPGNKGAGWTSPACHFHRHEPRGARGAVDAESLAGQHAPPRAALATAPADQPEPAVTSAAQPAGAEEPAAAVKTPKRWSRVHMYAFACAPLDSAGRDRAEHVFPTVKLQLESRFERLVYNGLHAKVPLCRGGVHRGPHALHERFFTYNRRKIHVRYL